MNNSKECEAAGRDRIGLPAVSYSANITVFLLQYFIKQSTGTGETPCYLRNYRKSITKAFIKIALISTNERNIRF